MVVQLCDVSGGASILDHDLKVNKLRNFPKNWSGWASIPYHPSRGKEKKIKEEIEWIILFET